MHASERGLTSRPLARRLSWEGVLRLPLRMRYRPGSRPTSPIRATPSEGVLSCLMNPRPAVSGLRVSLPQHPDEHRPKHSVLLAVDQQLGEGVRVLALLGAGRARRRGGSSSEQPDTGSRCEDHTKQRPDDPSPDCGRRSHRAADDPKRRKRANGEDCAAGRFRSTRLAIGHHSVATVRHVRNGKRSAPVTLIVHDQAPHRDETRISAGLDFG